MFGWTWSRTSLVIWWYDSLVAHCHNHLSSFSLASPMLLGQSSSKNGASQEDVCQLEILQEGRRSPCLCSGDAKWVVISRFICLAGWFLRPSLGRSKALLMGGGAGVVAAFCRPSCGQRRGMHCAASCHTGRKCGHGQGYSAAIMTCMHSAMVAQEPARQRQPDGLTREIEVTCVDWSFPEDIGQVRTRI